MDEVENLFDLSVVSSAWDCPYCLGRGFVYDEDLEGLVECPLCEGSGQFDTPS